MRCLTRPCSTFMEWDENVDADATSDVKSDRTKSSKNLLQQGNGRMCMSMCGPTAADDRVWEGAVGGSEQLCVCMREKVDQRESKLGTGVWEEEEGSA